MTTFEEHPAIKYEGNDEIETFPPVKEFSCSLCGFKFTKEKFLARHFNLCKDVENPIDRLGAVGITASCKVENHVTMEPTLDMKVEEVEFTETTVSGYTYTVSGQSVDPPKGEPPEVYMRRHTTEKAFKCTICDYAYVNSSSLTRHMRTHSGEKPFKCTSCDYACTVTYSLTLHMRTHTGETPFKCTLCDYSCAHSTHLKVHMRTHTGEKPFKCTLCDYSGSVRGSLKVHMTTHTGEKPFKCILCEYACSSKGNLEKHMRRHKSIE